MYKITLLIDRNPELDSAAFAKAWAQFTGPKVAPPGLIRHVSNRVIKVGKLIESAPEASYDAVEELWFEGPEALTPPLTEMWLAGHRPYMAEGAPLAMAGTPNLLWENLEPGDGPAAKIIILPVRKDGLSVQEFRDHWMGAHAELALGGPHSRERLLRLEDTPNEFELPDAYVRAPFEGTGSIEFVSAAALQAEFTSDHYRDILAPDEPRFTNPTEARGLAVVPTVLFDIRAVAATV